MARIYVSSTFSDLQEYREQVRLTLKRMDHEDVAMEYYGASEERPLDKCLSDVASCDVYVGIFAWRYGYIPNGYSQSITELEYHEARKLKKSCLIFILSEDAPWARSLMEIGAIEKIEALRAELQVDQTVAFFSNRDELASKVTQALSQWEKKSTLSAVDRTLFEFVEQYRRHVALKHHSIIPPNFGGERRKIPINDLYVVPKFRSNDGKEILTLEQMLLKTERIVVLAHPGGGKSTLALKLCHDLASQTSPSAKQIIPILVILRDYGTEKKNNHYSILEFITAKSNTEYQTKPPQDVFEELLKHENITVIFDGLDELLDTSYRQAIADDIELFCNQYPSASVIVTSREVGYDQAPLDKEHFGVFRMDGFDEQQITEYVEKWFSALEDPEENNLLSQSGNLLEELRDVSIEIKSNPLLLAALCNIYRGEGYIPSNKSDIYEKCTMLLFENRDKERSIRVDLPFESHVRPLLMYLANWIYGNNQLESGVLEKSLVQWATGYLLEHRYNNRDDAESAASKFVQFCIGRAWVFTDTGISPRGERIYQFTHRTFLEYFAASYLVRTHEKTKELLETLLPYLTSQQRTVIAELAFQQAAQNREGAADEILQFLLRAATEANDESIKSNLLLFAASCLEFISPKPATIHQTIEACVEFCIGIATAYIEDELNKGETTLDELFLEHNFYEDRHFIQGFLYSVSDAVADNLASIAEGLQLSLVRWIQHKSEYPAMLATEIALNLDSGIPILTKRGKTKKSIRQVSYLDGITQRILAECLNHIRLHICPKYVVPSIELFYIGNVSLNELIDWHGTKSLFQEYHHIVFSSQYIGEVAPYFFSDLYKDPEISDASRSKLVNWIKELGDILLSRPVPWINLYPQDNNWNFGSRSVSDLQIEVDNRSLFGIFCILAFMHERWHEDHGRFGELTSSEYEGALPEYFYWIFIARGEQEHVDDKKIEAEIEKCGFTPEQRQYVLDWASREIFVIG